MNSVVPITQDELLPPEVEARCAERLRIARTHMAAGLYHWIEAGKQFAANKRDLRGEWGRWCHDNAVAKQTADALISIADRFGTVLLSASNPATLQIDFRALQLLAAPSVPAALAEEAVARAAAGEHITKAEAQAMVERAKTETETDLRKAIMAEARARAADEIAELQQRVTDDAAERNDLRKRIKELDEVVNGKRNPDLNDVERVLSRYTGKRALSGDLIQMLAREIGKPIDYNGKTYPPVDLKTSKAFVEQIQRNQALLRALGYFETEAPPINEVIKDAEPRHISKMRQLAPIAGRWINQLNEALKKSGGNNGGTARRDS